MKKQFILTVIFALIVLVPMGASNRNKHRKNKKQEQTLVAKEDTTFAVAFYNLENLFDTKDDSGVIDEDFLPNGTYGWDENKYHKKLNNLSKVLSEIARTKECNQGAAVIGVSEVENRGVVEDLLKTDNLKNRGYRILHYDSPDARGIDCAMLYNPRFFQLEDSLYIHNITPEQNSVDWLGFTQDSITKRIIPRTLFGDTSHKTRGFLVGIGTMDGEKIAFIVNHWPSRGAESFVREQAGRQVKKLIEALFIQYPGIKVICMGDFNDDPDNKSMSESMQCKYYPSEVKSDGDIFNPWKYMLRKIGQGTLLYDGKWNLFDQILMTGNLVDRKMWLGEHKPEKSELDLSDGLTFYYHRVWIKDYMVTQEGRYKGGPLRTTSGGVWQNGFSDHFPTCIYLLKKKSQSADTTN